MGQLKSGPHNITTCVAHIERLSALCGECLYYYYYYNLNRLSWDYGLVSIGMEEELDNDNGSLLNLI